MSNIFLDYLNAVVQSSQNYPTEIYNSSLVNTSVEVNTAASTYNFSDQQQLGNDFNTMKTFRILFYILNNNLNSSSLI